MALVLALSSQVTRGYVGNNAAVAVLHSLGHEVWQIPTIFLSNHKGYRFCAGTVPPDGTIREMTDALNRNGWLGEVDAILSGYVATPEQTGEILYTVETVKNANRNAIYWCDPILGDAPGGLYVPEKVARSIADRLVPRADGISPNAFELQWLSDRKITDAESAANAAAKLPDLIAMTTSVPCGPKEISNVLSLAGKSLAISHNVYEQVPHGTGDVFTALALGYLLLGIDTQEAFEKASACIFSLANRTAGKEELDRKAIRAAIDLPDTTLSVSPV